MVFVHRELHPDDTKNLEEFKQHLLESQMELAPLKVWQLQGKNIFVWFCVRRTVIGPTMLARARHNR